MNEALMNNAKELLNVIIADALSIREFVIEEMPEVVQQILAWNFAYSLISFVAGVLIWIGFPILICKHYKWLKKESDDFCDDLKCMFNLLFGLAYGIVFSVCGFALITNLTWLQIWLAPKVYLIEYAANLTR